MSKRHTLILQDLLDFKDEYLNTYASHGGKKLQFDGDGNYYVIHKKNTVLETRSARKAVSHYNDLP